MQKLIIVTRIFSGIEASLISGHWEHSGSPAYYHFIRKIDLSNEFTCKFYLLSHKIIGDNQYKKLSFDNLDIVAEIIPYYSLPFSQYSSFLKKSEFFYNKVRQYALILSKNYRSRYYYVGRDNILLSYILLVVSRSNIVITRVLGVNKGLYEHLMHRNNIYSKIIRWVFDNDRSYFICTNDGSFSEATKEKIKNNRFYLLFNGVDKSLISAPKTITQKKSDGKIVISYISRIAPVKGHTNFIKALSKSGVKDKLRVYIIGDGELKKHCQSLVKDYGLDDTVVFTGSLIHKKAMEYLSSSDIFIAINPDGSFGNSVLEAANMGIPVVTLAHKSFSEKKYPFFEFIGIDEDIDEYLAKFIEKFVHSKSLQKSLAKSSVNFSSRYLVSWDDRIDTELDIIKSIAELRNER
jgi:glycosyltransferase involved in cell wall biosynthesis